MHPSPSNFHTLSFALATGYDLSVSTPGPEALRIAERVRPELVLLDVMMPGMDGFATLVRLRATEWGRDIPVIMVTADPNAETQVRALDAGAEDFVTKPVVVAVVQARVRNVLERKRLEGELRRLATTDDLTGVLGRRRFFELGEAEHARVVRRGHGCGVLMLDLDHFKVVNDRHGHAIGDDVLRTVARSITGLLRESDLVGRVGGEEFAVLLPHAGPQGARVLAERLRRTVARTVVTSPDGGHVVPTASIGVTQLVAGDRHLDEALQRPDTALCLAKAAGRDRIREVLVDADPAPGRVSLNGST